MSQQKYTNESIVALKGADRVRKRPSVIFGSDGLEGCQHSFFEILSNSIDEARQGFGREIKVVRHKDLSISVIDNARGIPVDYNQNEKKFNWELIFTELYAGGKYNNNDSDVYEYSLGLNGLGLCATQYSSEYMDVIIHRDGFEYRLNFEKGEIVKNGFVKEEKKYRRTGSQIKWRPDLEVFKDINIPIEFYQSVLKKQSIVNPGIKFILHDEESDLYFEYIYENGIKDYIDEVGAEKSISAVYYFEEQGFGRDRGDMPDYKVKTQIAFAFNNEVNLLEYFHNSSYLEHGGSPDKAVRNAFTYEIDKFIKNENKYNKNEKKISFIDIQDSLILVTNSFSTVTSYENQTKKAITNKYIQEFMTDVIKKNLEIYFIENKEEALRVVDQILINKRSREKAENTRLNLKKTLSAKMDFTNRVKKFINCRTKDTEIRELYILEGDSALGACKMARDSEFQALMPIRGKILNCLKADYDKIFKSEIITDLIKILGCGVEIKTRHNKELDTFNYDNLKWDKIIICTDADVDGFQIRTLVLTMIYRLVPTLIDRGNIYIAESPLFEINTSDGNTFFAYSEKEKNDFVKTLNKKYTIQRSKGLGENNPDMMWQTTMCPDSRKLIRISSKEDYYEIQRMFEVLLGDDLEGRKDFIEENGEHYLEMLDLS
ncbi:toprim domain-containing protein [Fusibacter ferrireducens]|uniref:DNA topoisomerase (ATP-hydrolyzing) n=1 Tax=Fusibacter ferrireducens TaxID=2785058 RepID=A0ABR9ZTM4_9FIRM|nr:toprim domain-containing protein [Fusibacter ferrireducens]MBF4693836.1 DNA topoisomerase [Fusibacter ferrireducens]